MYSAARLCEKPRLWFKQEEAKKAKKKCMRTCVAQGALGAKKKLLLKRRKGLTFTLRLYG
jgi:hypothetical protein